MIKTEGNIPRERVIPVATFVKNDLGQDLKYGMVVTEEAIKLATFFEKLHPGYIIKAIARCFRDTDPTAPKHALTTDFLVSTSSSEEENFKKYKGKKKS